MVQNIVFVRHGETDYKNLYYGFFDAPLNKTGINQAYVLKDKLKCFEFDIIYSSALTRANKTAAIINENFNLEIIKSKNLNEINFGDWEKKSYKELLETDKDNLNSFYTNQFDFRFPSGESFKEFYNRVINEYTNIVSTHNNILICAHNGTLKCIFSYLLTGNYSLFNKLNFQHSKYSAVKSYDNLIIVDTINS